MVVQVLVVLASWCLVSIALGLIVGRAMIVARGTDRSDEPTAVPSQDSPAARHDVTLPSPRAHDVVLDLTAVDGTAVVEAPGVAVQP